MIPGGPRNERQMQMMMRRLGMTTEPVEGVEEVVIRSKDHEIVIREAEVTVLTVQGVRTYQIVGRAEKRPRTAAVAPSGAAAPAGPPAGPTAPPDEDIQLVMDQAQVDREEAIAALRAADGAPAEAILKLLSQRGPP